MDSTPYMNITEYKTDLELKFHCARNNERILCSCGKMIVKGGTAESNTSDFRMSVWKETVLSRSAEENSWAGTVSLPTDRSFAAFGDVLFDGEDLQFSLSTSPFVVRKQT